MKNLTLFFALFSMLLGFQSCDNLTLNEKERKVKGAWVQDLAIAKLYFEMNGDKTFQAFAQSSIVKGVVVKWKGTWEVDGDQLKTDINEGPTVQTAIVDAKVGGILEKFGIDNSKIAFKGKINTADAESINMNIVNGVKVNWKKADLEKIEKLKSKSAE